MKKRRTVTVIKEGRVVMKEGRAVMKEGGYEKGRL
jgi:hypothetical protein